MIKHALVIFILLTGTSLANADSELQVSEPWVREAPPTSRVLAGYLTLVNTGDNTVTVTEITSPDFKNAEIHRTVIEEGIARMLPVEQLEVAASGQFILEPLFSLAGFLGLTPIQNAIESFFSVVAGVLSCVG